MIPVWCDPTIQIPPERERPARAALEAAVAAGADDTMLANAFNSCGLQPVFAWSRCTQQQLDACVHALTSLSGSRP
jgi:hypothetical protein